MRSLSLFRSLALTLFLISSMLWLETKATHSQTIPILLIALKPFYCARHGLLIWRREKENRNNIPMQLCIINGERVWAEANSKATNALLAKQNVKCIFVDISCSHSACHCWCSFSGCARVCLNRWMCELICAKGIQVTLPVNVNCMHCIWMCVVNCESFAYHSRRISTRVPTRFQTYGSDHANNQLVCVSVCCAKINFFYIVTPVPKITPFSRSIFLFTHCSFTLFNRI